MIIGIMGAMSEEIDSILPHMMEVISTAYRGRTYHTGKINEHDIVLCFSRWGKVAAADTVGVLIEKFKIEQLIFTGVAGATAPALEIGDIVISDKLYQHDMDARPFMPRYEVPFTSGAFFKADAVLVRQAQTAAIDLFSSLSSITTPEILARFNIVTPKCVVGTIATGDRFIANKAHTDAIMADMPETCAVEMEGAAIAQVCTDARVPFVVIRTISDKADHKSEIDFPAFINNISRHYSEHIVRSMLSTWK